MAALTSSVERGPDRAYVESARNCLGRATAKLREHLPVEIGVTDGLVDDHVEVGHAKAKQLIVPAQLVALSAPPNRWSRHIALLGGSPKRGSSVGPR
jgi:hypothetical protein